VTGLDIRRKLDEHITGYRQRLDGITTETSYYPFGNWNVYYKNDYNIFYRKPNTVQLNTTLKLEKEMYFKNGFSYNRSTAEKSHLIRGNRSMAHS